MELEPGESLERLHRAIAHSPIVCSEMDREGVLRWVFNSQLNNVVGRMEGRRFNELLDDADSAAFDAARERAAQTGERVALEVAIQAGPHRLHRLLSIEPVRDDSGAVTGFAGISFDITQLKETQAELRREVAFREQIMAILGHDLRNPVSAVQLIANLLLRNPAFPREARESVEHVSAATTRMSEMIETLLDYSRIRFQGQLPVARAGMDLLELCREVVDELRAAHPSRKISVERRGDVRGSWDRARLAQVVSNLVGNALTHGDGETPVDLRLADGGASVKLEVINRGPTIPADRLEKLFEPFLQGETTQRRHGLGLGLYIARQIVQSHGGSIAARSRDGWTTFSVELPR